MFTKLIQKTYSILLGEIMYRSTEEIKRIDFAEYTENRVAFWKDSGYEITEWRDKYWR